MTENIYTRIEELLKAQHKTQASMIRAVGIPYPQNYTNARRLGTMPKADAAVKIAQYLNTTVEYLVTGIEPTGKEPKDKYRACLESLYDTIKESLEGTKKNL